MQSRMMWSYTNNELGRIWKEAVMVKVLSRNSPEGTKENHEKPLRIAGLWCEI
jgi:hypothetical protein